ncbi:MAG: family 43 glycosylhydrolase [Bacteroidales bacterium]|jgi:beta-xylosidase|nr:family 43 glycosylhydrolase [Bacteroidales bacterium]
MYFRLTVVGILAALLCGCAGKSELSDNGQRYRNPVLGGDYPDPSVIRTGNDYYMTHSSFEYYPGLLVWHSTDLTHWKRISHALTKYVGSVWAPDLVKHGDTWYIYFPAAGKNWVVSAPSPEGPWSDPVDLQLSGFIDPGHVVDAEGKRHLYLSKGYIVPLADDGLSTAGDAVPNYEGWQFPKNWSTECFCLESPKSTVRNGYFYLTVAEGGTAGPATSHMVVSARASSPYGPFENSPHNPVVHTESRDETWWSQGHGTLVDDVNGQYWILYHGYEKGFHSLGRQTLMLPVEWTDDNWFRIAEGVNSADLLPLPAGQPSADGTRLSDDFSGDKLGLQWQFFKHYEPERITLREGKLVLKAKGASFTESAPLLVNASDKRYEVIAEYSFDDGVTAGITLFYDEQANARIAVNREQFTVFNRGNAKYRTSNRLGNHGFLRIVNDNNEVSFYYSADGKEWIRLERSLELTGFNHNVFGGFLSLRAGVYAFGEGEAVFDNFIYRNLDE